MKAYFWGAVAALILTGCTIPLTGGADRAVVQLNFAAAAGRSVAARALSASGDFSSLSYYAVNTATGAFEAQGPVTADTALVSLQLSRGQTYRVGLEGVPKANGAGSATGVYRFGDEALLKVPADGSLSVVRLWAQPTKSLVYRWDTAAGLVAYDPASGDSFTAYYADSSYDPNSQVFYGPSGALYYSEFYGSATTIHRWTIQGGDLTDWTAGDLKDDRGTLSTLQLNSAQIVAVCADPLIEDGFYLLAQVYDTSETNSGSYWYILHAVEIANGEGGDWSVIGAANIDAALSSGPLPNGNSVMAVPTSIAVDPFTEAVFVGSSSQSPGEVYYYRSRVQNFGPVFVPRTTPAAAVDSWSEGWYSGDEAAAHPVVRDLSVTGGSLWVLSGLGYSMNSMEQTIGVDGVGRADLFRLDPLTLQPVDSLPTPLHQDVSGYPSGVPDTVLRNPVRFSTGWTGGKLTVVQDRNSEGLDLQMYRVDPAASTVEHIVEIGSPQ